jgi:pimeloyl-ACP methyl ester carboxylesterase
MRHIDEWTTINGVRLHWQDRGSKHAPAILMLHALTQQGHTFDHVADRRSARSRCIALDFRGRGEREWADPETYTIPAPSLTAPGSPAQDRNHGLASHGCSARVAPSLDNRVSGRHR